MFLFMDCVRLTFRLRKDSLSAPRRGSQSCWMADVGTPLGEALTLISSLFFVTGGDGNGSVFAR